MSLITFFDLEVNPETGKVLDIGAIRTDDAIFHKNNVHELKEFLKSSDFICGHNILAHDLPYLQKGFSDSEFGRLKAIDTLLLSPLLFPKNPYHRLLKDDKLNPDELSNPLNDSIKAKELF